MAVISYIGATVAICVGTPATIDASGFAAVGSYTTAGQIVTWGDTGDVSEDVSVTLPAAPQAKPKKKITVTPDDNSQLNLL